MPFYDIRTEQKNSYFFAIRVAENIAKLTVDKFYINDLVVEKRQTVEYDAERDFYIISIGAYFRYIFRFERVSLFLSAGTEVGYNAHAFQQLKNEEIKISKILDPLNYSMNLGSGFDFNLGQIEGYLFF